MNLLKLVAFIFLSCYMQSFGEDFSLGVYSFGSLNLHNTDFRSLPGIPNCCPRFESGNGLGFGFGLTGNFKLSNDVILSGRFGYNVLNGILTAKENTTLLLNANPITGEFEHKVDSKISVFSIEPALNYKLSDKILVSGGIDFGIKMKSDYYQVETITQPANSATFVDESGNDTKKRTRNESEGVIPNSSNFHLFLSTRISYKLPLSNSNSNLHLIPELGFKYGLLNIVNGYNWKINQLTLGFSVLYTPSSKQRVIDFQRIFKIDTVIYDSTDIISDIYSKGKEKITFQTKESDNLTTNFETITRTDTIIRKRDCYFSAEISATCKDTSTQKEYKNIIIEEYISNRYDPLLSYIFYDQDSSNLNQKYIHLTKDETKNFDITKLHKSGTLEIYYNILNIIGKRLYEYPDATIKLTGCTNGLNSEKNIKNLSENRAQNVKKYLIDTWDISPQRISITSRNIPEKPSQPLDEPDKMQENQRVEISSDNFEILKPVFTTDTIRIIKTPFVEFNTQINSEKGTKYSSINLIQEENNYQIKSNVDYNKKTKVSIDGINPFKSKPLKYFLNALDNCNKSRYSDTLKLPLEVVTLKMKKDYLNDDIEFNKYSLILFDFDKSEIEGNNQKIISFIQSRLNSKSEIQIIGYTDRTGDENYNLKLSCERADKANMALNVESSKINCFGEGKLLYDNNLPEGRFYCRTVDIFVSSPNK